MNNHETIKEAGYSKMKRIDDDAVYLWSPDAFRTEKWVRSPHYSGYAVLINKVSYEYVGEVSDVRYCDECQRWEEK
jgi:hypothetical protein